MLDQIADFPWDTEQIQTRCRSRRKHWTILSLPAGPQPGTSAAVIEQVVMAPITAFAERTIAAPAAQVYAYIADMEAHHGHFLPPAFLDFQVESGGVGAGTVTSFKVTAGGRTRQYRMTVAEPEPGRVLTETDGTSSLVTTT